MKIKQIDIDDIFESVDTTIISSIQTSWGKGSGWIIDSVMEHNVFISKYNPLVGSTYIILPRELYHIDDSECFRWSLVRYLNPADHHPARINGSW